MREPRNPFHMRASEHIESDHTFLRLFGPDFLDLLPAQNLWHGVQTFQSAPGGGKTTLFRLFTPDALMTLYESKSNEDYKDLYYRLKEIGVFSETGPVLLGLMLSCARNYALLDDLSLDQALKERLLYSLLNARLILCALRGALRLRNLRYPDDLSRVSIQFPRSSDVSQLPIPSNGIQLYDWAFRLEKQVCEAVDSFDSLESGSLEGHDTLYALSVLTPECVLCDDRPVAAHTLVMFDDVHKLAPLQRKKLLTTLFDLRSPIGIWMAERLEALNPEELLGSGSTTGRDYVKPISLEDFWRSAGNNKRFEVAVTDIADKRVRSARDIEVGSFEACLQNSLEPLTWQGRFNNAIEEISRKIHQSTTSTKRYEEWIRERETAEGTPRERAISWQSLEILIERDLKKAQLSFDFVLPPEEMDKREASAVRAAAEYFVSKEFGLPYYFGISRLAALASSNIEQFLAFAGELFEEIISSALLKRPASLPPDRQQAIVKRVAHQRWDEIPRRVPNGRDTQRFLESLSQFAGWETNKPNAPYAPGVTGIGLSTADHRKLVDPGMLKKNPEWVPVLNVLSSCIAHNLLEVSLERSQGQIGRTWTILYLNRWLCLHFGLPIQYGGWRPKPIDELAKWLQQGFKQPRTKDYTLI